MWQKCKCILIPSEGGIILRPNVPHRMEMRMNDIKSDRHTACHLIVISNEHIKYGDWVYSEVLKHVYQSLTPNEFPNATNYIWKVIATTDNSLTVKHHPKGTSMYLLPSIHQSFISLYIELYNKGNAPVDVEVEYDVSNGVYDNSMNMVWPIAETDAIYSPITDSNNNISIKRSKESWSREEVLAKMELSFAAGRSYGYIECAKEYGVDFPEGTPESSKPQLFDKWIEQNL